MFVVQHNFRLTNQTSECRTTKKRARRLNISKARTTSLSLGNPLNPKRPCLRADKRLYIGGGDIDTEMDPWFAGSNLIVYDEANEATGWSAVPNSDDFAVGSS